MIANCGQGEGSLVILNLRRPVKSWGGLVSKYHHSMQQHSDIKQNIFLTSTFILSFFHTVLVRYTQIFSSKKSFPGT